MSGNKESTAEESSSSVAYIALQPLVLYLYVWFGEYYFQHCFFTGSIEVPAPFWTESDTKGPL